MIPLLFDFDGTLIDSDLPAINGPKYKETLLLMKHYSTSVDEERFNLMFQQFNEKAVNLSFDNATNLLYELFKNHSINVSSLDKFLALRRRLRERLYEVDARFISEGRKNAGEVLAELSNKFNLCLVTNAKRSELIKASLNKNLLFGTENIISFFGNRIVAYEDVITHKPDPECYIKALNIDKSYDLGGVAGIVFEDSIKGIKSAKMAYGKNNIHSKLFVIGVCSHCSPETLIDAGADMTLKSVCEVDVKFIDKILIEVSKQ